MNKEEKVTRKETFILIWSVTISYLDLWYENLSKTDWPGFMGIQGPFSFIWYHLHHMANLWSPLRSESEQQGTQPRCWCLLCSFGGDLSKICGVDVQTWYLLATWQGDRPSTTGTGKGQQRKQTANSRRVLELCMQLRCSLWLRQVSLPKDGWEAFADKAQAISLNHKPSDKHQRLIFMVLYRVLLAIKHHPKVSVAVDFHFEVHNSLQVNGNQ